MPNQTPAVVEKQLIDIDLTAGIDESTPEETSDWASSLLVCNNLVIEGNGLSPRPGVRRIGSGQAETIRRLCPARDGLAAIVSGASAGGLAGERLFMLEEGKASPALMDKGQVPSFSVSSKTVSSSPGGIANTVGVYGVINFSKYQVICHSMPNLGTGGGPFRLVIVDRTSGNIVRDFVYKNASLGSGIGQYLVPTMVGVGDRYIHLYLAKEDLTAAGGFKPKMTVIDTQSLPSGYTSETGLDALSYTDVTGTATGDRIAGVVALASSSTVVIRGATCRIENFNNSGVSVSSGTVASLTCTGVATDGTVYFLAGVNGGNYIYKEVSAAYSTTRTVTGPAVPAGGGSEIRIASEPVATASFGSRLIAYVKEADQNTGEFPCPVVYGVAPGGSSFDTYGYLPFWSEASLPIYSDGQFLVHMHNMMYGDTNDPISNCDAVIDITSSRTVGNSSDGPRFFNPQAVLDNYTASDGRPDTSLTFLPYGAALANKGPAYTPHVTKSVTAVDIAFAHWSRAQSTQDSAMSFTIDTLTPLARTAANSTMALDSLSGGLLTSFDGSGVCEFGFVNAPNFTVKDAGSGSSIPAGTYNYVVVFSYRDRLGRVHYSRTSRPRAITKAGTNNVTVQIVMPTVSMRYTDMQVAVYRTASAGTQYYLLAQNRIYTGAGTSTVPDAEVYMSLTDSTLDAVLIAKPLLYRQPGTAGTALDRYHAVAANHVIRHKDRIFYCNGNTVYFSSFAVDNEAPWFNPALSFQVPGGAGELVGLGSMDGILVCFKRDTVWVVDGDGPTENGGNGTEFSPPRQIHTEYGCVDARTLVNVPVGIMYRSLRGIELLKRNLQTDFIGRRVERTVNSCKANFGTNGQGACFDRTNSRVYFNMFTTVGTSGVICCCDLSMGGAWTTFNYQIGGAIDVAFARSVNYAGVKDDYVFMAASTGLFSEVADSGLDYATSDNFVPWTLQTGWVRGAAKQERLRVADITVLAQRQTNHNLKCTFHSDYNRSTATTIKTFTASDTNITPEVLEFQPSKENVRSMKFTITSETPTVSTSLGTGRQLDIMGLTLRLGLKGSGAKLPSAQKG